MNDEIIVGIESVSRAQDRSQQSATSSDRQSPRSQADARPIVVTATFTADALREPLEFWMDTLELSVEVELAPYSQLLQELLSPHSSSARNKSGFNVLLIRMEDWIRDRSQQAVSENIAHVSRVADEMLAAIGTLQARTSAPTLIFFCENSTSLQDSYREPLEAIQRSLIDRLRSRAGLHIWTHADMVRLYAVDEWEDPQADLIAHIPYSAEYFAAIATLIARRIAALLKPQYKVIAVDCDNTLWKGICGEDGPERVELTASHLALQRLLLRQSEAGVLICLCSKNNESDVAAVFARRPEMELRDESIICSRINWQPKSDNLKSIARQLDLSLDSFIFIDDSEIECAEVRANCPSVLTLRFPDTDADVARFLEHVWAFDRVEITDEARGRTLKYRQNIAREKAREEASDLGAFLTSLELRVDIEPMQPAQVTRVAELTQRTNQFNLRAVRRTAADMGALCADGRSQCLVVHVRDRFGDYGLVGVVIYRSKAEVLEIDTFLLSCRALGRGVEHRIVQALGNIAGREGLQSIALQYRATPRNAPAWLFLEQNFSRFRASAASSGSVAECTFEIPVEYALRLNAAPVAAVDEATTRPQEEAAAAHHDVPAWHEACYRLSRVADLLEAVRRRRTVVRGQEAYVEPRTPTEQALASIWLRVLRVDRVGATDNFFELGGDSLMAVQVLTRVRSTLEYEMSLGEFFENPTLEAMAGRFNQSATATDAIVPRARGSAGLSVEQRRLWFMHRLEGDAPAYHMPLAIRLQGKLDRSALQLALNALLERHEVLRVTFADADGEAIQNASSASVFALESIDLRSLLGEQRETQMLRRSREALLAPFDLSAGPVIRGVLFSVADDDHRLLIVMHHIVSDGWSVGILERELRSLYESSQLGRVSTLEPLPIQYADYAQWQRESVEGREAAEGIAFWTEHLRGAPELLELPTDRPRPPVQSYRGDSVSVSIDAHATAVLRDFGQRHGYTLAMLLSAAWSMVLSRLSGQADLVVGMPIANRQRAECEGLIGFFANTLALRFRLEDDPTVGDFLEHVKTVTLGAYSHQQTPFEQVVEALRPPRSLDHNPIFQAMFVMQPPLQGASRHAGVIFEQQEVRQCAAQFDLLLSLQEVGDGLRGSVNYATDLFDRETIERWVGYFRAALQAVAGNSRQSVSRLRLMSDREREFLIEGCNESRTEYPSTELIHEIFERRAARVPQAVAVTFRDASLTYSQLNRSANQLASYLRGKGVGPEKLVALYFERGLEMIVGILGVLKSGAAYVPLDPGYPAERLRFVLEDAKASLVLTQEALRTQLPESAIEVIPVDAIWSEVATLPADDVAGREAQQSPANLAYVIYTSGSTGRPKGVMVEHRNVTRLFSATAHWFSFNERDVWTLFHSFAFDFSVWEIWGALLYGGRLVVVPQSIARSPSDFYRLLCDEGVTVLNQTPSAFSQLIDAQSSIQEAKSSLRFVIFGGEALELHTLRPWMERNGIDRPRLINMYGITETTVHVTYAPLTAQEICAGRVSPIGVPIPDLQVHVLDRYGEPAPIGVVGEMYVGGAGVARGYLNRSELTAERFIDNHLDRGSGTRTRLYKSGDLARRRANGSLEYLGRNDDQVKLRGFRIELGEIEVLLARHPGLKDARVIVREDAGGDRRLVAYLNPCDPSNAPSVEEMRRYARAVLPEYMVPSAYVALDRMPLTANGKLDRKMLPAPTPEAYAHHGYEPPDGPLEVCIAETWRELLSVDRVGRDDDFFDLGGHSLLAVQALARLRSKLSIEVPIRMIFEFPALRTFAQQVESIRLARPHGQLSLGGEDIEDMLEMVSSMSEVEAQRLLQRLTKEARP